MEGEREEGDWVEVVREVEDFGEGDLQLDITTNLYSQKQNWIAALGNSLTISNSKKTAK